MVAGLSLAVAEDAPDVASVLFWEALDYALLDAVSRNLLDVLFLFYDLPPF